MSTREVEQAGRDQLARLGTTLPAGLRHAFRDPSVRDAVNQTYIHGARVVRELRGLDRNGMGGRLVRDADVHDDLTAMIRSAANIFDRAKSSRRSTIRRRALWIVTVAIGAATAGTMWARRRSASVDDLSAAGTPPPAGAGDGITYGAPHTGVAVG